MFLKFHKKNFVVFSLKSWAVQVVMELPAFFPGLRYDQIDDYGILYQDGLDPKVCLIDYLDYSIKYFTDMIRNLSKPLWTDEKTRGDDEIDLGSLEIFQELIAGYERDLVDLKKSRLRLTE